MVDLWILRYGELALKGKNRDTFENTLVRNISAFLKKKELHFDSIVRFRGRILVLSSHDLSSLRNLYGIVSLSPALRVSLDTLHSTLKSELQKRTFDTFCVRVQRLNKELKKTSVEYERELGAFVVEHFHKKVSLKKAELEVGIELIAPDMNALFFEKIEAVGGLPEGVSGRVFALIQSSADISAALLMVKRGCTLVCGVLGPLGLERLEEHCARKLRIVSLDDLTELDSVLLAHDCKALVCGQTLETYEDLPTSAVVFRPLLGYSLLEVIL